jgi:hypothetical protein
VLFSFCRNTSPHNGVRSRNILLQNSQKFTTLFVRHMKIINKLFIVLLQTIAQCMKVTFVYSYT